MFVKEGELDEADVFEWIDQNTPDVRHHQGHTLRFLIGSPEEHHSDVEMLPLPLSSSTYKSVCKSWHFPTEFLRMMLSTLPLASFFEMHDTHHRPLQGLMLRGARSRDWNFCLGLVHSPEIATTFALCNGMQLHEIDKLLICLKQSSQHFRDPMLLPVFLLELRVHFFAALLERRAVGIEEIEYATGMRHGFSTDPRRNALIDRERKDQVKSLDFDPITQKLTGVTGTLSFCDMTFSSSKRALDVVLRLSPESQIHGPSDAGDISQTALKRRIDYLDCLIAGSQSHCAVLSDRTKAQVQTVYSMIGQRDNRLNIETAAASREIAATGLFHNQAMKVLAEDSRKIAVLTRRDSLDMRIIAAVTLVFLPGTFMATMFGSGFFRFFPENSTKIVSGWVWLYWVLTLGVTAIVLLVWWFFSKRQGKNVIDAEWELRPATAINEGDQSAIKQLPTSPPTLASQFSRSSDFELRFPEGIGKMNAQRRKSIPEEGSIGLSRKFS